MTNSVSMSPRIVAGFTLIELMIAVVIVAILAAIAYPSYQRYVQQTREAEAQGQILELASALEAYRAKNFSYSGATAALAPELDANEHYQAVVNVGASSQSYTIVATPQSSLMSGMRTLTYSSAGEASWE